MSRVALYRVLSIIICALGMAIGPAQGQPRIVTPTGVAEPVDLAAQEVRRYVYQRTGEFLRLEHSASIPPDGDVILVAPEAHPLVANRRAAIGGRAPNGGFLLKSLPEGGRTVLVIAGRDSMSTLYGAYRFAEHLGVSFGLALDVVPDKQIELDISGFDEAGKPLVDTRGILPFHDFPPGPDFWDSEDYMSVIGQLPKLGMNFFGLHNYPRWGSTFDKNDNNPVGPEPAVWVGLPQDVEDDGTVSWAYPAYWAHTRRPDRIWGFSRRATGAFHAGASQIYPRDGYGSRVFEDGRMPTDVASSVEVFNQVGELFNEAFTHADALGVQTALGTELPMGLEPEGPEVHYDWVRSMPRKLKGRLRAMGKNPADTTVVEQVYEGIFERIKKTHPLDYYWLWSWEVWSMYGVSEEQIAAFERDMRSARRALGDVDAPFELAQAGWIIGTEENPAEFEDVLSSEVPMYGLWDKARGFEELSEERVKWTATWFEEDWGLAQPQFEVDRVYEDVKAGLEKGSDGVIAKHWRTRVLSMNMAAMKDLLWNYGPVGSTISDAVPADKEAWMREFYQEWVDHRFGPQADSAIGSLFYRLDRMSDVDGGGVPTPLNWDTHLDTAAAAPGAIMPNENSWGEEKEKYTFVDEFASHRSSIVGSGNRARFAYWRHTLEAYRLIGRYGTLRNDFRTAMQEKAYQRALDVRVKMARLWEELITVEIQRVTNESEMGEIANLAVLNWYQLMKQQWDAKLEDGLGGGLPERANPSSAYSGPPLVRGMPNRTHLYRGEPLEGRVVVLGDPESVTLHWRPLGEEEFRTADCSHIARGVYRAHLPPQGQDFEYYIEAQTRGGPQVFPASAPQINRTVVVSGRSEPSSEATDE